MNKKDKKFLIPFDDSYNKMYTYGLDHVDIEEPGFFIRHSFPFNFIFILGRINNEGIFVP